MKISLSLSACSEWATYDPNGSREGIMQCASPTKSLFLVRVITPPPHLFFFLWSFLVTLKHTCTLDVPYGQRCISVTFWACKFNISLVRCRNVQPSVALAAAFYSLGSLMHRSLPRFCVRHKTRLATDFFLSLSLCSFFSFFHPLPPLSLLLSLGTNLFPPVL